MAMIGKMNHKVSNLTSTASKKKKQICITIATHFSLGLTISQRGHIQNNTPRPWPFVCQCIHSDPVELKWPQIHQRLPLSCNTRFSGSRSRGDICVLKSVVIDDAIWIGWGEPGHCEAS